MTASWGQIAVFSLYYNYTRYTDFDYHRFDKNKLIAMNL